ncbi:flavoprotein [Niabella ginsenosidivorans]|uniref:Flavoprotein n=1 Tax=Niabella ginsenosidivorans TaxID=1176587 RepID=A0A1A9HZ94_9BACT|nr:NAD(P)/FAD-dependent oxidoreductase [Niabella ginsenosidivorans]ANH80727.1 flavoprotein [Niabella ginsenosidivorans]
MIKTVCIVGGGASGLFCAVNLARMDRNIKVLLLEKSNKLLSKVKISGGGRCNVTHACFDIEAMAKRYPRGRHFVKKVFHQFFTTDTIQWFRERGVPLKTEADGRMFPVTDSSETIIDCLLEEAGRYGVEIKMHCDVKRIEKNAERFTLYTRETFFNCDSVVIACGGFPKTALFQWLKDLGHTIAEPVPSLFTFNSPQHAITQLMGLSVPDARVTIMGTKLHQQGPVLITHWGVSGPAVLRLSAWAARELAARQWTFTTLINWVPDLTEAVLRDLFQAYRSEKAAQKISGRNAFELPGRFWHFLLQQSGIQEEMRWADLPAKLQHQLIRNLTAFELPVKGKTTYKEEFVTAGGITLSEIEPHTMMSKKINNLFFTGEIIDVDGITGGYNFQNAWSTGFVAASCIAGNNG